MNQKKAGVLLSYGQTILSTLISLTYTPVMLRLLGQSEYGLYTLVNGFVSNLSLLSFGMGSAYMRRVMNVSDPEVGLLNIGVEAAKGNEQAQAAYALMEKPQPFHFIGNVEARDALAGKANAKYKMKAHGDKGKNCSERQGSMKLTGVSDEVMEVFEITGFADILTIE